MRGCGRLALGGQLAFKSDRRYCQPCCDGERSAAITGVTATTRTTFRPAVMAKYAGTDYLVSGILDPVNRSGKLAYYHHRNASLQTAVTFAVDPPRSTTAPDPVVVTRLAIRVLSKTSVFRAAIDTDGLVNSLWEKRLGDGLSLSVSAFLNHRFDRYGLGVGLSFE